MILKKCIVCESEMECERANKLYCSRSCARKGSVGLTERECPICNEMFVPKNGAANQRQVCYNCLPDGEVLTRGVIMNLLRLKHGGECSICKYNRCLIALEFHHIDGDTKEFTISNDRLKVAEAVEEAKKCVLVCANCHREIHAGMIDLKEEK